MKNIFTLLLCTGTFLFSTVTQAQSPFTFTNANAKFASTAFHSGLVIPHYDSPHYDTILEEGMTFTIEPMLTLGTYSWDMWADGWTVVTKDRKRTAQFEHTLVVTSDGADILTQV